MTIERFLGIAVVIFTVGSLAAMGLELNAREAVSALRNPRFVGLAVLWSWAVGPAFAWLITKTVPLAEPYATGLLLAGPAPCAPFYPMLVRRCRGDMAYAGAFLLLTAVGTVVMMPLMLPLMIRGLTASTWTIAKPLLTLVLTPLLVGIAIRGCSPALADRVFPPVRKIAGIFTLAVLVLVMVLYGPGMLDAVGSFAIGAQLLFLCGMALLPYHLGFGLKQEERSVMSLGIGTRNVAAVFAVLMAIPNADPRLVVMVVLAIPLSVMVAFAAAHSFSKRAGQGTVA